ncbi:MAG: class I SAM-dependent RNA methyltransferase [Bdellovibrionaceae bacterium]|nr:class I SAM-dependent RNA methyltransferase [Pseudobdellovibrionaceae bacterium]
MNDCKYLSICTGCHFPGQSYHLQSAFKLQHLQALLADAGLKYPSIQFKSIAELGLRTRLDFTIEDGKFGLYDVNRNIVDIDSCLQISDELQLALTEFRKISFPIRKGSVRLRVGPDGNRGVWLDFANTDIKNLLNEKKSLQQLLDLNFTVEIGQKGKSLVFIKNEFKLGAPLAKPWFQAKFANNNYVSLNCLISSFTQPSWRSAEVMSDIVLDWVSDLRSGAIAEFGAGIGTFTLPLLASQFHVDIFESHAQAASYLQINASANNLEKNLEIFIGDYHTQKVPAGREYPVVLVNPPRSGLRDFVSEIVRLKPLKCIYISCYPESLACDLKVLKDAGWTLKQVIIVDQFPQTKHFETCVLLERINP